MRRLIGLVTLTILLVMYLVTLQTIPNGSEHYYMIDVGETQNVLNQWGTLHATGYPLYVMVGNGLVAGLRVLGVNAATAPGVTSLIYGMIALGLLYVLAAHVIEPSPLAPLPQGEGNVTTTFFQKHQHELLAGGMVVLFGLTRTVWVHHSIAEVYSFGLMIVAGLLLLALWPKPIRGRVYWLALLGGIGAFHHRAIGMAAPALVYAVWSEIVSRTSSSSHAGSTGQDFWINEGKTGAHIGAPLRDNQNVNLKVSSSEYSGQGENNLAKRYWVVMRRVVICLLLGLVGFLPYIYLPLRAKAGAQWVYGEPGTWNGFWDQFLGREATRFIGTPTTNAGLMANFNLVNMVLMTDVTLAGIVLGLVGLLLALRTPARRKLAITMLLSGGVAYGFHVLFYTDILSALMLPITLSLAFGWLLLAEWVLSWVKSKAIFYHKDTKNTEDTQRKRLETPTLALPRKQGSELPIIIVLGIVATFAVYLVVQNLPFIREMTTNPTGLETIALAKGVPDGAVLMLDWGPRYYAVAFAHDLLGEIPTITLVTHKADFKALVDMDQRKLVTADFTFYNRPISWWEAQLGRPIYLQAAAPHLVEIGTAPKIAEVSNGQGVQVDQLAVVCTTDAIELRVDWLAMVKPDHDLSVFVHLLDKGGTMIAQADESAPVYGWRPLTSWETGELVHDVYALPRLPTADSIAYGLYRQLPSGEFQNEYTFKAAVKCNE